MKVCCLADIEQAQHMAIGSSDTEAHIPMPETIVGTILSLEEQTLLVQKVARLEARLQALGEQT